MARILAQKLTDDLGQQVIVENRSGGGGNTGSDFVAKSEPDGYTLLFTAPGPLTVNQTLTASFPSIRPRTTLQSRCLRPRHRPDRQSRRVGERRARS